MGIVHATRGANEPASAAPAQRGRDRRAPSPPPRSGTDPIDWTALAADYDAIREHIATTIPGFRRLQRARAPPGRLRPAQPAARQHDVHDTDAVRRTCRSTCSRRSPCRRVACCCRRCGRTTSSTPRSTASTTATGASPAAGGWCSSTLTTWPTSASTTATSSTSSANGPTARERRATGFRVVAYPTARGCCAAYFPEANVLVPLESVAERQPHPDVQGDRRAPRATCGAIRQLGYLSISDR